MNGRKPTPCTTPSMRMRRRARSDGALFSGMEPVPGRILCKSRNPFFWLSAYTLTVRSFRRSQPMCLAVPGQVKQIYEEQGVLMGRVNFGGITKEVCLAYLPDISIGDYTIVHVGFAISKVDEESANATLQMFRDLGVLEEELGAKLETV